MRPNTAFVSSRLFPLHERLKSHDRVDVRQTMEQTKWLSTSAVSEFQLVRLREFLVDVGENIPYYWDNFLSMDFGPRTLSSMADLQRQPFLKKAIIRVNTQALKNHGAGHLARDITGGSSREPLIFFMGKKRDSHVVAAKWRTTRWLGYDIGDPEVVQQNLGLTQVLLVVDGSFADDSLQLIGDGFKKPLGTGVQVETKEVDASPFTQH